MDTTWRQNAEVFEQRAAEYDSWFEESLLFAIETAAIAELPLKSSSPSLEIGVGPGRFAQAFGTGFGIDPAPAPLNLAMLRDVTVCQAIGEALPFPPCSMARVSLFFTLCFVTDPTRVLKEVYNVLKDDGQLLLGFVPAEGAWGANLQYKKEIGHPFYKYARFHKVSDVTALLHAAGFTVLTTRSTLYQRPGKVNQSEIPRNGMDASAGFVALLAVKEYLTYTKQHKGCNFSRPTNSSPQRDHSPIDSGDSP